MSCNAIDEQDFPNICFEHIDAKYVSDGLEPYFRRWNHAFPVFISAQTGSGKNHFVLNKLIPYAYEQRQQVILVSNRVAASSQQKKELLRLFGNNESYTPDQLAALEDFYGDRDIRPLVRIWNYQSAIKKSKGGSDHSLLAGTGYIIFDEAHFFLSDALFNAYTGVALAQLTSCYSNYTRVYMSATLDDTLKPLIAWERCIEPSARRITCQDILRAKDGIIPLKDYQRALFYQFPIDYSNYKIQFFTQKKLIINKMNQASTNKKWLYFAKSKKKIEEMRNALTLPASEIKRIDTNSRHAAPKTWATTLDGELAGNILFATKVIDNGVSLMDESLHNIVIEAFDKVVFLQMLGRKRRNDNELVNLFVYAPTQSDLHSYISSLRSRKKAIDAYNRTPYPKLAFLQQWWPNLSDDIRSLFYVPKNVIKELNDPRFSPSKPPCIFVLPLLALNPLAECEVNRQLDAYTRLQAEMQAHPDDSDIFPRLVLNWLQRPLDSTKIVWLEDEQNSGQFKRLEKLLLEYGTSPIEGENIDVFYKKFIKITKKITLQSPKIKHDPRSGVAEINKYLQRLFPSYKVRKSNNAWYIIRTD